MDARCRPRPPGRHLVVAAVAEREAGGAESRLAEHPELLAGKVAHERLRVGLRRGNVGLADGGSNRRELQQAGAPLVGAPLQAHADDARGPEQRRLLLKAPERAVARLVESLSQNLQLAGAAAPGRHPLPADVIDRAAHNLPERLVADLIDEGELIDGEVAGEDVSRLALPACLFLEAVDRVERQAALLQAAQARLPPLANGRILLISASSAE